MRERPPIALAVLAVLAVPLAAQQPSRAMAVTLDDVPVATRHFAGVRQQRAITERLVAALTSNAVPATGFVNEIKLYMGDRPDTARIALIRHWAAAGLELGNHTYSHPGLHAVTPAAFLADVDRGATLTRGVLAEFGRELRWFRHPYLHTGRTVAIRDSVTAGLAARGYRVAPVTVDGYDFLFAAAYERALARPDSAEAARIADAYVDYMARSVEYWEGQSRLVVGREIPQVLLLHASALNADTFGRLAAMLRGRGYAFVTLEQALADPAYGLPDTYTDQNGISWLHRWGRTRGMSSRAFAGEPPVPPDIRSAGGAPAGGYPSPAPAGR